MSVVLTDLLSCCRFADFVRRTALRFDAAPALTAPELPSWYEARLAELEVLKRASVVNKIFEGPKLVVERDGQIEVRPGSSVDREKPLAAAGRPRVAVLLDDERQADRAYDLIIVADQSGGRGVVRLLHLSWLLSTLRLSIRNLAC